MEEKKGCKIYSRPLKWAIVSIQMICVLVVCLCGGMCLYMGNSVGNPHELLKGTPCEKTELFSNTVYEQMSHVQTYLKICSTYQTKGVFNPNKTIDITNVKLTDKSKQDPNTTYTVGAIKEMVESGIDVEITEIVQNAPYYEGMETTVEEVEEMETTVKEVEESYSAAFSYLYENGIVREKVLPLSGVSLAEYAKENRKEVSLRDLYLQLSELCTEYNAYEIYASENQDTGNLKYYIVNTETNEVCTNAAWSGINEAWETVKNANFAIHYIKTPQDTQFMKSKNSGTQWLQHTLRNSSFYGNQEVVVIAIASGYPAVDWFQEYHNNYQQYQRLFLPLLVAMVVGLLIGISCFVIATIQTGRNQKGGLVLLNAFDRIPTEVCLALQVIVISLLLNMTVSVGRTILLNSSWLTEIVYQSSLLIGGVVVFMVLHLSIARRVKAKTLWQNSICKGIVGMGRRVYQARNTSRKVLILLVFFLALHIFLIWVLQGLGVLMLLVLDVLVLLYLLKDVAGRQTVKTGLANIAAGDLDYKIDLSDLMGNNLEMAEAVNQVAEGLQLAVEKSMKDERMRSELITNVSHDIKTPLTSIINYVELLKREEIDDEKIKGYIKVLESKAQRLKQLTEDLVEASKISTGNIELQLGRIYMQEMIKQACGEFDNKFEKRSLEVVLTMAVEPIIIWADGRRMWRILENIFSNIAKYALAGTRVYIDLRMVKDRAVLMFKNISEEPLNISADELTERFVRGDASRTTEGSGLGLSIAKSLTEMQNGEFEIYLDGDLFKVTLLFELMGE